MYCTSFCNKGDAINLWFVAHHALSKIQIHLENQWLTAIQIWDRSTCLYAKLAYKSSSSNNLSTFFSRLCNGGLDARKSLSSSLLPNVLSSVSTCPNCLGEGYTFSWSTNLSNFDPSNVDICLSFLEPATRKVSSRSIILWYLSSLNCNSIEAGNLSEAGVCLFGGKLL